MPFEPCVGRDVADGAAVEADAAIGVDPDGSASQLATAATTIVAATTARTTARQFRRGGGSAGSSACGGAGSEVAGSSTALESATR